MNKNTPFRTVPREELEVGGSRVINGANGDEVAFVQFDEDAEFIVKACNAHDELVEALQAIQEKATKAMEGSKVMWLDNLYSIAMDARATLAKLEK